MRLLQVCCRVNWLRSDRSLRDSYRHRRATTEIIELLYRRCFIDGTENTINSKKGQNSGIILAQITQRHSDCSCVYLSSLCSVLLLFLGRVGKNGPGKNDSGRKGPGKNGPKFKVGRKELLNVPIAFFFFFALQSSACLFFND